MLPTFPWHLRDSACSPALSSGGLPAAEHHTHPRTKAGCQDYPHPVELMVNIPDSSSLGGCDL